MATPKAKDETNGGVSFEIVSEDVWEKVEKTRPRRGKRSPIVEMLAEQSILFIPDGGETTENSLNGMYEAMRRQGFKLALRKGEHKGKPGHFAKATKIESEGAAANG